MPRHIESQIQRSCKKWFDYQYGQFSQLLFAVPNGGLRGKREAAIMKAEGMTAGVADMILLVSRKGYGSLCIEFKTAKGRQRTYKKSGNASLKSTETNMLSFAVLTTSLRLLLLIWADRTFLRVKKCAY